ncbi:sensor histidine kinase [Roseateles paludis]|uniref:histidine kinase n=1 Tax=Roseateles paludis TaxID=3145238 RepID=A0ABV0G1K2_9BURK
MIRRWLLVISLVGLLPWAASAQPRSFETLRLSEAEIAVTEGTQAPLAGWTPARVPEVFAQHPQAGLSTYWLRFSFELAELPAEPLVLLVHRVALTAEFRLNGSLLNPGVRFEQPGGPAGTNMLNEPQWIVLPGGLFRVGHNELLVRLRADRVTAAWLSNPLIGSPQALRGEYLLRHAAQRVVPQVLFVLLLAGLVFGLRLWWRERLLLLGLVVTTTVLWLLQTGLYLLADLPLPWRAAVSLVTAVWIAFHWALLTLLWRLSGSSWSWFPRALQLGSGLALVGSVLVLILEPTQSVLGLLFIPTTVLRFMTTVMLLRWAWRVRSWAALLLVGSELLWFAGPLQLMLMVQGVVSHEPFMLEPGCALPLVLVLFGLAAQRLAQQREAAAQQRQQGAMEERQRMLLEMHDGIGSQLVTGLRLARREDAPRSVVVQAIQNALTDLRLVMEAQEGAAQELQTLMQHWRERTQPQLEALGIALQWDVQALPRPHPLSALQALQVLRILQEALSNALQHGQPRVVSVSLAPVPGGCELCIGDDGVGLGKGPLPALQRGRGLDHMRCRAERLGGQLEVGPGAAGGTVVRLVLPAAKQA